MGCCSSSPANNQNGHQGRQPSSKADHQTSAGTTATIATLDEVPHLWAGGINMTGAKSLPCWLFTTEPLQKQATDGLPQLRAKVVLLVQVSYGKQQRCTGNINITGDASKGFTVAVDVAGELFRFSSQTRVQSVEKLGFRGNDGSWNRYVKLELTHSEYPQYGEASEAEVQQAFAASVAESRAAIQRYALKLGRQGKGAKRLYGPDQWFRPLSYVSTLWLFVQQQESTSQLGKLNEDTLWVILTYLSGAMDPAVSYTSAVKWGYDGGGSIALRFEERVGESAGEIYPIATGNGLPIVGASLTFDKSRRKWALAWSNEPEASRHNKPETANVHFDESFATFDGKCNYPMEGALEFVGARSVAEVKRLSRLRGKSFHDPTYVAK